MIYVIVIFMERDWEMSNSVTILVNDGFFVKQHQEYYKVCYADILWIQADNNYSDMHLRNGKVVCITFSLTRILEILPCDRFVRVHRSFVVNLFEVDRIVGNMLYIGKHAVDVSRRYRKRVFGAFKFLDEHES